MSMLDIKNLHVSAEGSEILKGLDLHVNPGEVHAIMGPNGSGKSTLARALSGHPLYLVTEGEVRFEGKDLLAMDPDERAREGVFMAFQYPVEIAGVNNANFLKAALNAKRKHLGQPELDAFEFITLVKDKSKLPAAVVHRRDPLPAAAHLYRARLRARAERRQDREIRRQGAGAGARGERLRLD